MGPTAVILGIQCVDGDVDQMEDHFTAIHVSVWILQITENFSLGYMCILLTGIWSGDNII